MKIMILANPPIRKPKKNPLIVKKIHSVNNDRLISVIMIEIN
jgi:hypothetical protein